MAPSPANQKLQMLQGASEQISANLVALELDFGRQLVEASTLRGESAARWSAASAALTELWRREGLLQALVQRAERAHGSELRELFEAPSIELGRSDVALADRRLLQSPESAERCTPDELLRSMSDAFEQVKAVVAAISQAWDRLTPRIDEARRLLRAATDLADQVGDWRRADLEAAAAALTRASAAVTGDPLSVTEREVDELLRALHTIHAEVEASAALKNEFEARMLAAHELVDRVRGTIRRAHAARDELQVKITAPAVPALPGPPDELERMLVRIGDLAGAGSWGQAQAQLADWTDQARALLEDAERALTAIRAPIEARNQFRALLDAYQVKAARLGLVEQPELAHIFARAREVLYQAPTDLAAAAQLTRSYQQAISGWPETPTPSRP